MKSFPVLAGSLIWINFDRHTLLNLAKRSGGKFVAGLKPTFQQNQLHLCGGLARLAQPKIIASWLRPLFRKDWVVYSKPPIGGPFPAPHPLLQDPGKAQ